MTITITQREFEAIGQILNQVCTDYEAASDEKYLNDMGIEIEYVHRVLEKYKIARYKAKEFQQVRAFVADKNKGRNLRARDIDKLARNVLKKMKEG